MPLVAWLPSPFFVARFPVVRDFGESIAARGPGRIRRVFGKPALQALDFSILLLDLGRQWLDRVCHCPFNRLLDPFFYRGFQAVELLAKGFDFVLEASVFDS